MSVVDDVLTLQSTHIVLAEETSLNCLLKCLHSAMALTSSPSCTKMLGILALSQSLGSSSLFIRAGRRTHGMINTSHVGSGLETILEWEAEKKIQAKQNRKM